MKNLKKLSAIVLSTLFATMQISVANDLVTPINTGLGSNYGGANINSITGGYAGHEIGTGSATLNFDANSHVNWQNLNLNSGETLNFNAVNGANGLTVLNTVNQGMSNIYGQINANSGIGKLIISNPNGVLFDGAKFTTAGDVMVTTKNMSNVNVNNLTDGTWGTFVDTATGDLVKVQVLNDSDFNIGGQFSIVAPKIVGENSKISTGSGLKLTTVNGSDYLLQNQALAETKKVTELSAMNIDGDVVITNDAGALLITKGTKIDGNLKAEVGGLGVVYGVDENNKVEVTGDVDLTGHGQQLILRNAKVDGNVDMKNDGGYVEINNATIGKNANLTTTGWQPINHQKYNHHVHVNGNTDIGGDLNIESSQNIHIGNYKVTQVASGSTPWGGQLLDGKLTVGGDIKAHTTGGHIMTTIDTSAKNVDFHAESNNSGTRVYGGNILSNDKATITADTYKFKSDGYIGAIKSSNGLSADDQIINIMEEYVFIPDDTRNVSLNGTKILDKDSHEYMNINGGTISKIETPKVSNYGNDVQVYIRSKNDLLVNGADAGVINLVAPDKKITVTGDVHAKEINVGGRTGTLQLDFPNRDFTTNYTNIRDGVVTTIAPDEEITYDLTNNPNIGYNSPDLQPTDGTNTTYLVGPDYIPTPPPVEPDPVTPTPDPTPNPNPTPSYTDEGENARNLMTQWAPDDIMQAPVNTPVAFAADLDDDEYGPCRKNVDGSVTVVRAYPMAN